MARARAANQTALDEQVIEDQVIEDALEKRQKARDSLGAVRQRAEEADELAKHALQRLELPVGAVARVGRFRIERKHIAAGSVSFERRAKDRLTIGLVDED